jgi:hypothetical protein
MDQTKFRVYPGTHLCLTSSPLDLVCFLLLDAALESSLDKPCVPGFLDLGSASGEQDLTQHQEIYVPMAMVQPSKR